MGKETTIPEGEEGSRRCQASPSCIPSALGRRPGKVSETRCPLLRAGSVALKRGAVITLGLTPFGLLTGLDQ